MPTLIKLSMPGWEKEFETDDDLKKELYSHICNMCRTGEKIYDEDGELIWHSDPVDELSSIDELLCTPCGCEYETENLNENQT